MLFMQVALSAVSQLQLQLQSFHNTSQIIGLQNIQKPKENVALCKSVTHKNRCQKSFYSEAVSSIAQHIAVYPVGSSSHNIALYQRTGCTSAGCALACVLQFTALKESLTVDLP